ncbi:Protein of unknown function [Gryllus bimaculatus]|nr:Protein of unknown function [Gryllus bimaculatus]
MAAVGSAFQDSKPAACADKGPVMGDARPQACCGGRQGNAYRFCICKNFVDDVTKSIHPTVKSGTIVRETEDRRKVLLLNDPKLTLESGSCHDVAKSWIPVTKPGRVHCSTVQRRAVHLLHSKISRIFRLRHYCYRSFFFGKIYVIIFYSISSTE